jgi:DNA-directed RNA polymerase specialized sigma subunit
MRRISALLTEALGREPTDAELAEELGLPRQTGRERLLLALDRLARHYRLS